MGLFEFTPTKIEGLYSISKTKLGDERGFLSRVFCQEEFFAIGWKTPIAQINYTNTGTKGTVRGMHYQLSPMEEIKVVSCIKGEIFDVALDLRPNSKTYLKWESRILSETNWQSFCIPQGVAHGFQTLSDSCEILYLHSKSYSPENEAGINPLDALIGINWPLEISSLSERDKNLPFVEL